MCECFALLGPLLWSNVTKRRHVAAADKVPASWPTAIAQQWVLVPGLAMKHGLPYVTFGLVFSHTPRMVCWLV